MSQSPAPLAGPSSHANRTDANLLRQFVMEYLQQHGFEKALQMLQQGIADQNGGGDDKDADGVDEPMVMRRGSAQAGGREAIFRAPGPVPIESTLKRNIPQAMSVSASMLSERLTPEFEAQAKYVIEQLQRKLEANIGQGEDRPRGDPLLDPSDRIEGYRRYRRWLDGVLDLWKVGDGWAGSGADGDSLNSTRCAIPYSLIPSWTCCTSASREQVRIVSHNCTNLTRILLSSGVL